MLLLVPEKKTAKPFQRKLISRSDVKAQSAVLQPKKRHVELLTRLPTERLATACWDFIVVKSIRRGAAPVLVFGPLQGANIKSYTQDINSPVHFLGISEQSLNMTVPARKSGQLTPHSKRSDIQSACSAI
jgi:hypothetical protein